MEAPSTQQDTAAGVGQTPAAASVRRSPAAVLRATGGWLRRTARSRAGRRAGVVLMVFGVSLTGLLVGVLLGARTETDVGPFRAEMSITPALFGDTEIDIPPLGSLHLDSHDGPVHLKVQLGALDQGRTEALIDDPDGLEQAGRSAVDQVTEGVMRLGVRALGTAVLAALALAAMIFRNMRRVAWSGAVALLVTGGSLGLAALTVRLDAIEEPRYEGLLVNAPAVVGDARRIADNYGRYAQQLQDLIGNVGRIYSTVSGLPVYQPAERTIRILHVSDLHLSPTAWPMMRTVVQQFDIDAVIDTGDITDWGSEPEASYVAGIGSLQVPYVYIRGNHDSQLTQQAVARQTNAVVLDNTVATVAGLRIAGIGDPRFTPDKNTSPADEAAANSVASLETANGSRLADTIARAPEPVDLALVHDPAAAGPLAGACPLVLAGHTHQRVVRSLEGGPAATPTRLMVQGSTGGAGLRGLEGDKPLQLAMSVLYFDDQQHALKAYDDILVGGPGQAQVALERKVIDETPATAGVSPTPSGP